MPRRQFSGDPCRHEAATMEERTERSRPQTPPSEITREKEQIKPKVKGRKEDHLLKIVNKHPTSFGDKHLKNLITKDIKSS